ncbi:MULTISPECIES: zf-HC2 domain-containing protein [unclassified Psychrobacillus]|uniref:zf-HC2 domain-containing protein n=1 Tax=unclassified Psychrobacillus TaxID=2636677 RepID=UPI001469E549|nr:MULTISPECIES: zf-HC2 domain-containing protein [unclassified Psychrobacillus]MCM3360036.1 zf-HC2 domain-containing protein [Psychrobacillus sp. MER TA 171]NME06907.1 anti-sigma factor [Psychrobacillus sp. BL-248-WT-3]
MSACPERIVHYMHEYLDGEISREHELELKSHLQSCQECRNHMHELSDVVAFVKGAAHVEAPNDFTLSVMSRLPKEKSHTGVSRWFRQHPVLTAAAMFMLLMSSALFSNYNNDQQFSFTKQENVIVEGETVIIPEGQVVKGDLIVKNGDVRVDGELDGNLTVINGSIIDGSKYMASTANVTGKSEEINKAFDWLWYTIKDTANEITSFFKSDKTEE